MSLVGYYREQGTKLVALGPACVPAHFGDVPGEYAAASAGVGLHDRSYRGLIEITGADRAGWLHNLTTNEIANLPTGDGKYVFALNVKGRVLFDGNVLALPEALLLDIDRRWIAAAIEHMSKYIIMEDVQLADRSEEFRRLALVGPKTVDLSVSWRRGAADAMSPLQHDSTPIDGVECRVFRHDFAGPMACELIVPANDAVQVWEHLLRTGAPLGLAPVGLDALQVLRVEAGIPWSLEDVDGDVLPAETRQIERGVSFTKGCYLGQELVERLRALGAPAKLLVGLTFDGDGVHPGAKLTHDGQTVGRVTSAVHSFKLDRPIGMGYVKAALAKSGTELGTVAADTEVSAQVDVSSFDR